MIKVIQLDKQSVDSFFIRSCAVILLLRLCLPVILGDDYVYISENLSNLIISGLIFLLSFFFIFKKLLNTEAIAQSKLDIPILLALSAETLSLIYSAYFSGSFNSFLIFFSYIFFFYILYDSLSSKEHLYDFWCYFLICSLLVAFIGIWEYLFAQSPISIEMRKDLLGFNQGTHFGFFYKRIASLFDWPNLLAGFLMLAIPLTWTGLMLAQKLWQKRILAIFIFLFLVVFFLTFSFMCCVGFFIASLLVFPLVSKERFKGKTNNIPSWVVVGSLSLFFLMILLIRKDFNIAARMEYLKIAFFLLKDNPWFGTGAGTFSIVSTKYITYHLGFSSYVHNSYLQLWVENGILGFIAVVSLVIVFARTAFKVLKKEQDHANRIILIGFFWAITAFLVDNLTNYTMLRPNVALFWWAILAAFFAFERIINVDKVTSGKGGRTKWKFFLIFYLFILAVLLFIAVRMSLGLLSYQEGVKCFARQDINAAASFFHRSRQLDPTEFNYPMAMASVDLRKYFFTHDARYLDLAQKEYEQAAWLSPDSHKIYFMLSNIATEKKDYLKANQLLKQAIRLCPIAYAKKF